MREYYAKNPEKQKERSRKRRKENPERKREENRACRGRHKHRYNSARRGGGAGLSPEEIAALVIAQGGRCALCGETPEPGNGHNSSDGFCVDHDHSTGAVRELLCYRCNLLVGWVEGDLNLAEQAIAYVRKHSPSE